MRTPNQKPARKEWLRRQQRQAEIAAQRKELGVDQLTRQVSLQGETIANLRDVLGRALNELREFTRVDVDMGYRGECTIIMSGVYKGQMVVRSFDMNPGAFGDVLEMLHGLKRYSLIRNVDAPPTLRAMHNL